MHDEYADDPEVRAAINLRLRKILNADGWGASTWDAVLKDLRESHGIKTDLLQLAQNAPCLVEMFQIAALTDKGLIAREAEKTISEIIHNLVRIAFSAKAGDETASNQLKVLHKVAHRLNYDLPATVIKNLADSYHTSPHLARAWDVRNLMIRLSYVIEPTRPDKSVLDGPIKLTTRDRDLIDDLSLYEEAEKHIRRGTTLLSLATSIYIEQLDEEGIRIDPRQIRLDFEKLKEWEAINLTEKWSNIPLWHRAGEYRPASVPPMPIYSNGWKRLWRRGNKDRKKLS